MIIFLHNKLSTETSPWQTMLDSAIGAFPEECCGFIYGRLQDNHTVVISALTTSNAAQLNKHHNFKISPAGYLIAERFADENQLLLFGVYHSHPNHPAFPSLSDHLSAFPNLSYIIISVSNQQIDEVRCWQLNEDECFAEQKIRVL